MNQYKANREKLFNDMKSGEIAVFFAGEAPVSSADSLYPFRTDKNFYYLTGLKREGFILIMAKDEVTTKTLLFVSEPNDDIEKWIGRFLSVEACKEISGIEDVHFIPAFERQFNVLVYTCKYDKVYLDLSRVYEERLGLAAYQFSKKVTTDYPQLSIKNAHGFLQTYRGIKSEEEIELIRKAIALTKEGLERVMTTLKPGDYEYVPQAEFNYSIMRNGADGNAFETIAASGGNATVLHYIQNDAVMADGDLILMDLGAQYQEYASDITRTYPINGQYSERQKTLYNLVLAAHDAVIEMMAPGVLHADLNKKASEILAAGLKAMGMITEDSELGAYYYHGVSHPMGLDTHDIGLRTFTLEPGMVLTVEPGLYIAEENIGIRIEDDVLITEDGNEVLSAEIIRTADDIEAFMAESKVD